MKITSFLLLFCLFGTFLQAQNDFFKNPPITISVYSHSIGLPFKSFVKLPLNIGVAIGTEFTYNKKELSSTHQGVQIGWYHHENLNTSLWIKTDFIQRFTAASGLVGEVRLGAGYAHDFNAYETFALENGSYQTIKQSGKGSFISSIGIGGGYELPINDKYVLTPFVRYEGWFQLPYSKFQAVLPHTLLHLGTRLNFQK